MKWTIVILLLAAPAPGLYAQDPVTAVIREGITRVIKAVDLQVQRLQTATVWLQDAQRLLENAMQELHLGEIRDWVQAQKDLYAQYFDELWRVKTVIIEYQRVGAILDRQAQLVKAYNQSWGLLQQDNHFSPAELAHMAAVYAGILQESLKELDRLKLVIQSFSTQMSDASRLQLIDQTAGKMEQHYNELSRFNNQNALLSLQRAKDEEDIEMVKKLYGL